MLIADAYRRRFEEGAPTWEFMGSPAGLEREQCAPVKGADMEHSTAPRRARGSAERLRAAFARAVEPALDVLRGGGLVENGEIAAALNARSVPAEGGGGWTPQRVAGLRRRLEALNGQSPGLHHRPVERLFRRKFPAPRPGV